ncbi:hypothetical protein GH714_007215 [Hevea brasiliensis]|uniref:Uncharacterized protein n=1 Tax=Hevea brasiliensis TaxID=3981 RepID=A0A6A6MCH6_HEVBR|nr:hypothetical protein GH714_007215 [Hevea brasiliensis]
MKAVDQLAKPLLGVAHNVPVQLGNWAGIVDLSVVPLKDFQLVIGLDFMERVLPFPLTEDGCMTFRSAGHDYTVAVERQPVLGGVLLAMQVAKGVKKGEKTFLVAYKEEGTPSNSLDIPHDVSKLLQEFSDMMPSELPKKLPLEGSSASSDLLERVKEGMAHNSFAKNLLGLAKEGNTRRFWEQDELIYTIGNPLFIPLWGNLRKELLKECHDSM